MLEILHADPKAEAQIGEVTVKITALLCALCRGGPPALRSVLVPCLGFLLNGQGQLLYHNPCLLDSLRSGLAGDSKALRARTLEMLAWLFAEEGDARCSAGIEGNATYDMMNPLAQLQMDIVRALSEATSLCTASKAFAALSSLHSLRLLDIPHVLPQLLATCLSGSRAASVVAGDALLQVAMASPEALVHAVVPGVCMVVQRLSEQRTRREIGDLLEEEWRFVALREAFEGPLRDACLCEAFLKESLGLLCSRVSHRNSSAGILGVRSSWPEADIAASPLFLTEVVFGILAGLTYQAEEVSYITKLAAHFHTDIVVPLLSEASGCTHCQVQAPGVLGACAASVALTLLRRLHEHDLADEGDDLEDVNERFVATLQELADSTGLRSALRDVMAKTLPLEATHRVQHLPLVNGERTSSSPACGAMPISVVPPLTVAQPPAVHGIKGSMAPVVPAVHIIHGGGDEAWRAFTPSEVKSGVCMARTWGHGAGRQCGRKRVDESDFCSMHHRDNRWQAYGRVDGEIPAKKLQEFIKCRAKHLSRTLVSPGLTSDAQSTPQVGRQDGGSSRVSISSIGSSSSRSSGRTSSGSNCARDQGRAVTHQGAESGQEPMVPAGLVAVGAAGGRDRVAPAVKRHWEESKAVEGEDDELDEDGPSSKRPSRFSVGGG